MNGNEIIYYNINNKDIRASTLFRFLALKNYITVTSGYLHPKLINHIVYGYFRALIANDSEYSYEFYRDKDIFNKSCIFLTCSLTRFEESFIEVLGLEKERMLEELYYIVRNAYNTYIRNDPRFKDAVVLCNYEQEIFSICSIGTINEFRYRELNGKCIMKSNINYQDYNL